MQVLVPASSFQNDISFISTELDEKVGNPTSQRIALNGVSFRWLSSLTHCGCTRVYRFSEPFSTDAGPASHRVRLWRGGPAYKVLLLPLLLPQVRLHGHLELRKGSWLLLWSREELDGAVQPKHSSFREPCVASLLPVTNFFPLKYVFNNLPCRAAALVAGAPHCQLRTPYAAGWWLDFVRT